MKDADLPEARDDLAQALGWSDVPQEVWVELVSRYLPDIEQAFGSQDWEDVAVEAWEIYKNLRGKVGYISPPGRAPTEERPAWQLKKGELERSWAFSDYVAKIAFLESDVQRFRTRYLGGDTIHPDRARTLLTSPTAALWPSLEFKVVKFSVLDHTYQVLEKRRDDNGDYAIVEAYDLTTGETRRFKDRRPLTAGAWSVGEKAKDALSNSEDAREIKGWKLLVFPHEEDGIHRVCVKSSSILGELHKLAGNLIQKYPWWESEAVWFVLTGATPWIPPVSMQARGTGHSGLFERQFVTIKAEPWVSEETIQRTYREAQIRLLQGDNRPAREKQIRLFRFISSKTGPYGLDKSERADVAKTLVGEWDSENPGDAYGSDTRRFWRDYDRAFLQIAQPMKASAQRKRARAEREHRRR